MLARSARVTTLLVLLVALVPSGALAHEDAPNGFRSTVRAIRPALPGLQVRVLGGDDQLHLVNETGTEVVVLGYQGEPYLRFSADGVYGNHRSPATYLSRDRFAEGFVPAEADARAAPRWVKASAGPSFSWHDHRVQWMFRTPPPAVQETPGEKHRIFAWSVPAKGDGRPLQISGTLEYLPRDGSRPRWWLLGVLLGFVALAAVVAAVLYLRRPERP